MRSIWAGSISFGMVVIPVKLYAATEQRDVAFRQVHREDGGRYTGGREFFLVTASRCIVAVFTTYRDIAIYISVFTIYIWHGRTDKQCSTCNGGWLVC